jgi:hypothetical protein
MMDLFAARRRTLRSSQEGAPGSDATNTPVQVRQLTRNSYSRVRTFSVNRYQNIRRGVSRLRQRIMRAWTAG